MARRIEAATGIETRATILGYMQRGGGGGNESGWGENDNEKDKHKPRRYLYEKIKSL